MLDIVVIKLKRDYYYAIIPCECTHRCQIMNIGITRFVRDNILNYIALCNETICKYIKVLNHKLDYGHVRHYIISITFVCVHPYLNCSPPLWNSKWSKERKLIIGTPYSFWDEMKHSFIYMQHGQQAKWYLIHLLLILYINLTAYIKCVQRACA